MKKTAKIILKDDTCDSDGCSNHHGCSHHHVSAQGTGSAFYGLGFIGAAIYYVSTSTGFWMGVLGLLKALVWPAFLVFHLLRFLVA